MKNSYKETDINLTLAANECLEVKIDYRIQPTENIVKICFHFSYSSCEKHYWSFLFSKVNCITKPHILLQK